MAKSATKSKTPGSDPYKIYDTEMSGTTQSGDKTKTQDETIAGGTSTSTTFGAVRNGFVARATGSDPYKTYDTELSGATQAGDKTTSKDEQIAGGSTTSTTGAVVNKASWMGVDLNGQTVKSASKTSTPTSTTSTPTTTTTPVTTSTSANTEKTNGGTSSVSADKAYDEALRASAASNAIATTSTPGNPAVPGSATKSEEERQAKIDEQKQNLWDSLQYSYGQKIEQSNKQYNQAKNTADLQAQKRGMGRSSYNQQILANYDRDAADAANNIYSEMIADYQNRVGEIEKNALENEHWEAEFGEKVRSNMAQEALSGRQLTEAERSNRAQEALSGRQLTETERSNLAKEALSQSQLEEDIRSHQATESYNLSKLEEDIRSNKENERLSGLEIEETSRHNKAGEENDLKSIEEDIRHHQAEESYNLEALEETKRSNEESEKINWASIDAQYGDHTAPSSNSSSSSYTPKKKEEEEEEPEETGDGGVNGLIDGYGNTSKNKKKSTNG